MTIRFPSTILQNPSSPAMEEMEVLKKASAEILLNMAKESAARVMLSERKALGLEHQLRCTKDEAVRLLVRMNNMIYSTIDEARSTSLNHQRKIDELEAQLQEGEDKITDLRAELYWMQDKLDKMKKDQVTNISDSSPSELKTMRVSEKKHKTLNSSISDSNCCKRNGCTPRIPTSERNSPDPHTMASLVPCPGSKNMEMIQHLFQKVGRISRSRILRKKKPQYGKVKANSWNSRSKKVLKPCIRTECKAVEGNSNILMENLQPGRIPDELIINNGDSTSCSTAMNPDSLSESCQQYSSHIESKGCSFSLEANTDFSKHQNENEDRMRPLTNLDPDLTLIKSECSRNLTVSIKASKKCGTYRYPLKNDDSKDDQLVKRREPFLTDPLRQDQATTDGEFLQYKRKRKKESVSCPYEIASPENTNTKRLLLRLRNVCC